MNRLMRCFLGWVFIAWIFGSCAKEYSYESGTINAPSKGTLKDSTGNCMPITVYGTYYDGIAPGDTNYVKVEVNVLTAGSYTIKTDLQNGFQFADSGFFNTTGLNTVTLKVTGTPILDIPTTFTVTYDSTSCTFGVNVEDSTGKNLGGNGGGGTTVNTNDSAWYMTGAGNFFHGFISSSVVKDTLGFTVLTIFGQTNGDSIFFLAITMPSTSVATGIYLTTGSTYFAMYDAGGNTILQANPGTPGVLTTVNITSYDPATMIVKGIFSGTAEDASNTPVDVTGGQFTAQLP